MNETERMHYVTNDRSFEADFVIKYRRNLRGFRIYLMTPVNYKKYSRWRLELSDFTHRIKVKGKSYYYICWSQRIPTMREAKKVAELWAECTAYYIKFGGRFKKIAELLHEPEGLSQNVEQRMNYTSRDGSLNIDFQLKYRSRRAGWKVYIMTPVNYRRVSKLRVGWSLFARWDKESQEPYRYVDASHWGIDKIESLEEAQEVAKRWTEWTARYIKNGLIETFLEEEPEDDFLDFSEFEEAEEEHRIYDLVRGGDYMPHEFERQMYLTKDGSLDIDFVFMDCEGTIGWRIYIITPIDYKRCSPSRPEGSGSAHWLKASGETYRYVCWSEKIESKEDAKEVARLWAECTAYYIKHGGDFGSIARNINL